MCGWFQFGPFFRHYKNKGMDNITVSSTLEISMVYSYSPEVEELFKATLHDPYDEITYLGLAPAILEQADGSTLSIQRIWLTTFARLWDKKTPELALNSFHENFLYERRFNANWQPLERGSVMGIPTATNCRYQYRTDGPMDPRLFWWNNTRFLAFNAWQVEGDVKKAQSRMFMWNYDLHHLIKLNVPNDFKTRLLEKETNWTPLVVNDSLYLIYSYDPLRVFKCDINGDCSYAQWPKGEEKCKFDAKQDALRGGSPFILYKWPYYIAIGHVQVSLQTSRFCSFKFTQIGIRLKPRITNLYIRPILL